MKIERSKVKFTPYKVEITVETKEDHDLLYRIFSNPPVPTEYVSRTEHKKVQDIFSQLQKLFYTLVE